MPLDPQAAALLAGLAEQGVPSAEQVSVTTAREIVNGLVAIQSPPVEVAAVADLLVTGHAGRLPVRVYQPARTGGPRPLLVYLHGGGWITGNITLLDSPLRLLANATGAVVASVGYRLAPENPFPAPAEDAYAAVVALAAQAADLGADPGRLVVAGDSAGGNLTAVVALMARDRGGPRIDLQVLLYPVTGCPVDSPFPSYTENADGYLLSAAAMRHYWELYAADPSDPYACPLAATDLANLPPALVLTAEYDPLRDEGEQYARRLAEAGGEVTAVRYDGTIHGFFWMPGTLDRFGDAVDEITTAVGKRFS